MRLKKYRIMVTAVEVWEISSTSKRNALRFQNTDTETFLAAKKITRKFKNKKARIHEP